ncbi:MAG TPA: energy transducer TonB [Candidatus Angelobacter sp.]|nr:energy transducer TonB [Candidatus Angelobacter sp.]
MSRHLLRGRAPLPRKLLGTVLCALFFLPHAVAFQTQVQIQSNDSGRKIKNRITPEYPELAIKAKLSGTARVELTVTADGSVKEVKELGGNPVLLAALVRAVKQWRYEPAPRETLIEVKAAFSEHF